MRAAWLNSIGIAICTGGTVFTLWSVLATKPNEAGTWGEQQKWHKEFPKEKRCAKWGLAFIVLGAILQIVGQFL